MNGTSWLRTSSTARLPAAAGLAVAEAGIEEAGIVHAELADQRIEGHHLGGIVGRHVHRLARHQDVELVGIEDQLRRPVARDRLPEIERVVVVALVDVDDAGVALGAIADDALGRAAEIDGDGEAVIDMRRRRRPAPTRRCRRDERLVVEARIAGAEAHLRQARAGAHQNREGARADLDIERPVIAGADRCRTRAHGR